MTMERPEPIADRIQRAFDERVRVDSQEGVLAIRELASVEQMLSAEYGGRFLLELLQNAGDAFRKKKGSAVDGVVRIHRTADALIVANIGKPIGVETLLQSLTQVGASDKPIGEGIGHKGLGFRSVLEISDSPEIYSQRNGDTFELAVRFDRDLALERIREGFPEWDHVVAGLTTADKNPRHIPILKYAIPNYAPSPEARRDLEQILADEACYETVIRLPLKADDRARLQQLVTTAIESLSSELVILLGSFSRILIHDEVRGSTSFNVDWGADVPAQRPLREVTVERTGSPPERWLLYRGERQHEDSLVGDAAVAVRLGEEDGVLRPVRTSSVFHVFFPTEIATHLPFLCHGYFWVDASRRHFAETRVTHNRELLERLGDLVLDVITDLVERPRAFGKTLDADGLVGLLANEGTPKDRLVDVMRKRLFAKLRGVPWIPCASAGGRTHAAPVELLVETVLSNGQELVARAFPPARLAARAPPMFLPRGSVVLGPAEKALLTELGAATLDATTLEGLLTGKAWGETAESFYTLMAILGRLVLEDSDIESIVRDLRGNPDAAFIPTLSEQGDLVFRPPPGKGPDDARLFLRLGDGGATFGPPSGLGFAFLPPPPAGEVSLDAMRLLGIKSYDTDAVLTSLRAHATDDAPDPLLAAAMTRFVWRLLLRESQSRFGVLQVVNATGWDPGRFFWRQDPRSPIDTRREDQRRREGLSSLRLPAADGVVRPAGDLVFTEEWAEGERVEVYRDLAAWAAPPGRIASRAVLQEYLPLDDDDARALATRLDIGDPTTLHHLLLGAFLRQLGVWETAPVRAFSDHEIRSDGRIPWSDVSGRAEHLAALDETRAFTLTSNYEHKHVHVGEDAHLAWPLASPDSDVALAARVLARAETFYAAHSAGILFCPKCRTHTRRYTHEVGAFLDWQLRTGAWVPSSIGGGATELVTPASTWVSDQRPEPDRLSRSGLRFLRLADAAFGSIAQRYGARSFERATVSDVRQLLKELRARYAGEEKPGITLGDAASRGAFISLHRILYERLVRVAKDEIATHEVLDDVGVLAEFGDRLTYLSRKDAYHDDGTSATYKLHFVGEVGFAVTSRGQDHLISRLGLPVFRVDTELRVGQTNDITALHADTLSELIPMLLALQVFHPMGGPGIDLGGERFRERALRLRALRVFQVDSLEVIASLGADGPRRTLGGANAGKLHLDLRKKSAPKIYVQTATDRLPPRLGPQLAMLLENGAYDETFDRLITLDDDEREEYLLEKGISPTALADVRKALDTGVLDPQERAWWESVLASLGVDSGPEVETRDDVIRRLGEASLRAGTARGLLFEATNDPDARFDTAVLEALEALGSDIEKLSSLLDRANVSWGLRVNVAATMLRNWLADHAADVRAALLRAGLADKEAGARMRELSPPESLRYRVRLAMADVLEPVVGLLMTHGVEVDAKDLAKDGGKILRPAEEEAPATERGVDGPVLPPERDRVAWQKAVVRLALAALPGELVPAHVRELAAALDEQLESASESALERDVILNFLRGNGLDDTAAAGVAAVLMRDQSALADIEGVLGSSPLTDRLNSVVEILAQRRRRRAIDAWKKIDEHRRIGRAPLIVRPVTEGGPQPAKHPSRGTRKRVNVGKVKRDPARLTRLGAEGEEVALYAVLDPLLRLAEADAQGFRDAISEMIASLEAAFDGTGAERVLERGRALASITDLDELIETLTDFVHLSRWSDGFGCDVLGWLAVADGEVACPVFLEVKSDTDRKFPMSRHEWETAERLASSYGILVVLRGATPSMELLVDPFARLSTEPPSIARKAESFIVSYRASG